MDSKKDKFNKREDHKDQLGDNVREAQATLRL